MNSKFKKLSFKVDKTKNHEDLSYKEIDIKDLPEYEKLQLLKYKMESYQYWDDIKRKFRYKKGNSDHAKVN